MAWNEAAHQARGTAVLGTLRPMHRMPNVAQGVLFESQVLTFRRFKGYISPFSFDMCALYADYLLA
jgi:hypothetical protein